MARKHKPEDIIGKLREAEIVLAQGGATVDVILAARLSGFALATSPQTPRLDYTTCVPAHSFSPYRSRWLTLSVVI